MKTKLLCLFLGTFALTFTSCETENSTDETINSKQNLQVNSTNNELPDVSPCITTDLLAGKRYDAGDINVYFDAEKVYVQFEAGIDWHIKKTHLYVGDAELIPVNRIGDPIPGLFPMGETNTDNAQSLVYAVSKADLPKCFTIAAHSEVYRFQPNGQLQLETAWARGERFTQTNWAMYFNACQDDCSN